MNTDNKELNDFEIRPMTEPEQMYSYTQSAQLQGQTGLIGHLRADMDTNGQGFFSTWFGFRDELKTPEFKDEFDEVINALRFDEKYGGVLASRDDMSKYCRAVPESGFAGNYTTEYGFRVNTEKYAYLLRLNPVKGDYNLYCYCYRRDWLDRHLKNAEKGIRFIDSHYNNLFRVPDGGKVKVTCYDGEVQVVPCRYIDEYHLEFGTGSFNIFHICELAERLENNGSSVEPIDKMPEPEKKSPNRGEDR